MRHSIQPLVILIILIFTSSCFSPDQEVRGQSISGDSSNRSVQSKSNPSSEKEGIKYLEVKDQKLNMTMMMFPIPISWKEDPAGQYSMTGPEGVKVHKAQSNNFAYSNSPFADPALLQLMGEIRPPVSMDEYIDQDLLPTLDQKGLELMRIYSIPQYTEWLWAFDQLMFKYGPRDKFIETRGIELKDRENNPYFLVAKHEITNDGYSIAWNVVYTIVQSNKNNFQSTKIAFINSLINCRINPEWQQTKYQIDSQQSALSQMQHEQNMATQRAMARAGTARHRENMDALDRSMESFRERQRIQDQGHENMINTIHERTTIADPYSGTRYQVESGSNQYWGNGMGEYIRSDDLFYNPNQDLNLHRQNWTEYIEQ